MSKIEVMKFCIKCGCEFESERPDKICPECKARPKMPSFAQVNKKLIEDVRISSQLGISYGKYKANERNYRRRAGI